MRDKIRDLLKLGEMKWRYKVVEMEQSPRDEAIKVLDEAHDRYMAVAWPSHDRHMTVT